MSTQAQKRDLIIQTGRELFFRFGIRKVTVDEICREAGISRVTFYKYFSNKMDLARTILSQLMNEGEERYVSIMEAKSPFAEKVEALIQLKMDSMKEMSDQLVRELIQVNSELEALFEQRRQQFWQRMEQDFRAARANGDIRQDIRLELIFYFMNHLAEMAKDPALLSLYAKPKELVGELTRFFFYGILPPERKK